MRQRYVHVDETRSLHGKHWFWMDQRASRLVMLCALCLVWLWQSGCALPSVRVSAGASAGQTTSPAPKPSPGAPAQSAVSGGFALDVNLGAMMRTTVNSLTPDITKPKKLLKFLERHVTMNGKLKSVDLNVYGLTFLPEVGYSLDSHLFPAKLVVGFGMLMSVWRLKGIPKLSDLVRFGLPGDWAIGYIPSFVLAGNDDGIFPGMRNSLYLHLFQGLMTFELQHEFYLDSGRFLHTGRVVVGVNLGLIIPIAIVGALRKKM